MQKLALAFLAAFALVAAAPAFAGEEEGCKNCPAHKKQMAENEKDKKDDKAKPADCGCKSAGKECKCGAGCKCGHHGDKKDEKKTT
ncbi:MAG: hypothetical protein QM704_24740 [Anaeromyxobacteraceae bacterium]